MELILYRGAEAIIAEVEVDDDTGEILTTEEKLAELARRNPIGCAAYILHEQARADMIDRRIDELQGMRDRRVANVNRVKESLKGAMKHANAPKLASPDGDFRLAFYPERDASVEVRDEKALPPAYLTFPEQPAPRPNKKALLDALKAGKVIPGAELVKNDRLEIRKK